RCLAKIWQAAWDAGNGDDKIGGGSEIDKQAIIDLYNNPDVVPSVALDQYPDAMIADWSGIQRLRGAPAKNAPHIRSPSGRTGRPGGPVTSRGRTVEPIAKPGGK